MIMEKLLEMTLLYDFYGELFTERQKEMFELYYLNDLSLSEIGEQLNISRQAVRDSLKHTEQTLQMYEDKLCLIDKFLKEKSFVAKIQEIIGEVEIINHLPKEVIKYIEQLRKLTDELCLWQ